MSDKKKNLFFSDLFKRRVLQILGIYIAGCWTVVQIVEWIINRFLVSPHLTDLCLVSMVSFIPSVCLIAYFHGTPGRDKWQPIEKIGIPINIIASIIMVIIVFAPKDLGAVTESITIEDESGNLIIKVVPKTEFRKKIAIFFFENESSDSTLNWLRYGLPWLSATDLEQDLYISDITQEYFDYKVDNAGYNRKDNLPISLKMKIAKTLNKKYFLDASFNVLDGNYMIKTKLYKTENGNLITDNHFVDSNIFKLADKLTKQLKIDLEIPLQYIDATTDLPVASISTDNQDALRLFILGREEEENVNFAVATNYYNKSIEFDKYFLQAQFRISIIKMNISNDVTWKNHLDIIMKSIDKLSDRNKFSYKMHFYYINGDEEYYKRLALRQVKLYPYDIETHNHLANVYKNENIPERYDNAINEYKIMLDLDPDKYELYIDIGNAYYSNSDFNNAIKYFERYSTIFVEDPDILSGKASAYWQLGNYEKSISVLEEAILLSNEELYLKRLLLYQKYLSDNIESNQYIEQLNKLLDKSESYTDTISTYHMIKDHYFHLGNIKKSYEFVEKISYMHRNKYGRMSSMNILLNKNQINIFKHLNMMDSIKTYLDYYAENSVAPYDNKVPYVKCIYYLYMENYDMLAATIDYAEDGYAEF